MVLKIDHKYLFYYITGMDELELMPYAYYMRRYSKYKDINMRNVHYC
jgi:hypothetical protein